MRSPARARRPRPLQISAGWPIDAWKGLAPHETDPQLQLAASPRHRRAHEHADDPSAAHPGPRLAPRGHAPAPCRDAAVAGPPGEAAALPARRAITRLTAT